MDYFKPPVTDLKVESGVWRIQNKRFQTLTKTTKYKSAISFLKIYTPEYNPCVLSQVICNQMTGTIQAQFHEGQNCQNERNLDQLGRRQKIYLRRKTKERSTTIGVEETKNISRCKAGILFSIRVPLCYFYSKLARYSGGKIPWRGASS